MSLHFRKFYPGSFFSETPLGTLPVLEYNGNKLTQSITIARFLAKEVGIVGKNNMEQAKADMVVDTIVDVQGGKFRNH